MNNLKDVYMQRLTEKSTQSQNSDQVPITIKYTVDLVTALNNVSHSNDFNHKVPFKSGVCYLVEANAPNGTIRTYKCMTNADVQSITAELDDPNNAFYRENPLLETYVTFTNISGETMSFNLVGYGTDFDKKNITFSKGTAEDFTDTDIASVKFLRREMVISGDEWRADVTGYYENAFYELVVFGNWSYEEFLERAFT